MKSSEHYAENELELGSLLMKAFNLTIRLSLGDMADQIKKIIEDLNLPLRHCDECSGDMSFFDYSFHQGLCPRCEAEAIKKYEKEP